MLFFLWVGGSDTSDRSDVSDLSDGLCKAMVRGDGIEWESGVAVRVICALRGQLVVFWCQMDGCGCMIGI